jgi:hypothetical protein
VNDQHGDGPKAAAETQWTDEASRAYKARAEVLTQRLASHVRLTAARHGRQRELEAYIASAEQVQEALNAFAESEFDWCGSFPVRTSGSLDDDWDEDVDEGLPTDEAPVASVLGRWDYVVTDAAALMDGGRSAYLRTWPKDTVDDANVRVTSVESAMGESCIPRACVSSTRRRVCGRSPRLWSWSAMTAQMDDSSPVGPMPRP